MINSYLQDTIVINDNIINEIIFNNNNHNIINNQISFIGYTLIAIVKTTRYRIIYNKNGQINHLLEIYFNINNKSFNYQLWGQLSCDYYRFHITIDSIVVITDFNLINYNNINSTNCYLLTNGLLLHVIYNNNCYYLFNGFNSFTYPKIYEQIHKLYNQLSNQSIEDIEIICNNLNDAINYKNYCCIKIILTININESINQLTNKDSAIISALDENNNKVNVKLFTNNQISKLLLLLTNFTNNNDITNCKVIVSKIYIDRAYNNKITSLRTQDITSYYIISKDSIDKTNNLINNINHSSDYNQIDEAIDFNEFIQMKSLPSQLQDRSIWIKSSLLAITRLDFISISNVLDIIRIQRNENTYIDSLLGITNNIAITYKESILTIGSTNKDIDITNKLTNTLTIDLSINSMHLQSHNKLDVIITPTTWEKILCNISATSIVMNLNNQKIDSKIDDCIDVIDISNQLLYGLIESISNNDLFLLQLQIQSTIHEDECIFTLQDIRCFS